jgi:hypothetical protein
MKSSGDLYQSILDLHEAQRKQLAAATRVSEAVASPSYQLRPVIIHNEGIFIAVYGDVKVPGGHIVGRGLTPESALADFDQAFKRTAIEQYRVEADNHPKKKK